MRKILSLLFILICSYTFAQPVVNRAGAANTVADANLFALRSFRPPVYADTTAANNAYPTLDSAGKVFYSFNDKAIWFRQHSPKKWVKLADQNLVNNVTGCYGLLNGGIVTWSGVGLVMNVTASYYVINCNYYNADGSLSVTLSTADPTNPRIDVIAVDTSENIVVITGTPGATPVKPQVNPTYQVELTDVYVPAGATTPNEYTYKTVYNENVEWTSGSTLSSGTVNFNSTVFPSVGTKNLRVASGTIGNVYWDTTGAFLTSNYQSLSLRFSLASSPTNDMLPYIYLRDNGVQVTYSLALDGFGYSSVSGINEYNVVTVPMSAFTFTSGSTFDGIGLYFGGIGAIIDVDYVQLQTGTNGGGVIGNYLEGVRRLAGSTDVEGLKNGVWQYLFTDSTGSGSGGTDTTSLSNRINQKWDINGNIGLTKSNFIGTIDSVPITIRVHNKRMFFISDTWDSTWSDGRGSMQDILIGDGAGGIIRTDTIKGVIAIGDSALANYYPTSKWAWSGTMAIGHYSGKHNTTGVIQAVGWQSLKYNTTGYRNVAYGPSSGRNNITGGYNSYFGQFAGEWATSSSNQTLIGNQAGRAGAGDFDTYTGSGSGYLSTGSVIDEVITAGGSGYTYANATCSPWANAPHSNFVPPGYNLAEIATGTAVISGGAIVDIVWNNIGRGFNKAFSHTIVLTGDGTGASALPVLDYSAYNTSNGGLSFWNNYIGKWNTNMGYGSGYYGGRDTGTTNIGAGSGKLSSVSSVIKNATSIGYNARTSQSNTIILGDTTVQTKVGIGTTQPTAMIDIRSAAGYGFRMVDGYEADGRVLQSTSDGSGRWGNVRLSQLAAASALNDIDNGSYTQTWRWSAIESNRYGMGLRLSTSVLNAAPLRIEGYSNSWGANLLRIIDSNSAAGSGSNHTIIQTMSPLLPPGSIQNALAFGTDLSTYNSGYIAFINTGTGLNTNRVSFSLHGVNEILTLVGTNRIGIGGIANPTGRLHLPSGGTSEGTGQLKFSNGDLTTVPETGNLSFKNGILFIDSSDSKRDTIASRDWVKTFVENEMSAPTQDTSYTTIATFTAGAGFASDTTMCTDSTLFGSFFTGQFDYTIAYIQAVIKGNAGDSIVLKLVYNDTFNVDGTKVNGAGLSVNNRYTGNVFTISTNRTIAANTWVWLKPEAVITGKKPKYISVTLVGYKTYVVP